MREKNQETRADIIAEMRMGKPVGPCAYRIGLPDKEEVYESGAKRRITMIKDVTVQELADRLEAATKREKAQPGNAAAMREALVAVKKSIDGIGESSLDCDPTILMASLTQVCARLSARIERALSAPARNCDLYASATEALKAQDVAFNEDNFKNGECKLGCPGCDDGLINCKILWLFATAKERKGPGI